MISYKRYGIKNFLKKDFGSACMYFSLALQEKPSDSQLRIYLTLANLAKTREDEAMSLFEFYRASFKNEVLRKSLDDIEGIIDSLEISFERLNSAFINKELEVFLAEEKGISYDDFLSLVQRRGDFRRAFEDIMFSTKVLISKKEDFVHFLNLLVDNGFSQMALNYLESAASVFKDDNALREIVNKVEESNR